MTTPKIRTNLAERLKDGRQLARKAHRDLDHTKLGTLRAGNSGIMSKDGDIAGSCHRRAHLRSLGIEVEEPDDSKLVMFQMGTANEDVVYNDLVHTSAEDEVILREEEIPISWTTSNGTRVTGRPDMVVCEQQPSFGPVAAGSFLPINFGFYVKPIWGIEIKSIASVWTTRDVLGNQQPKLEHMIQAGHYSWKLGVPFRLLYKQYSIQEIPFWKGAGNLPGWGQKLFPKEGKPGSEYIDYEKGRIQPFEISYELEWCSTSEGNSSGSKEDSSFLRYRRERSSSPDAPEVKWTRTMITQADIGRYYEFVSRMAETGDLGPRPLTVDGGGKEKSYSSCSYCPLKDTCKATEKKGYDIWLGAVRAQQLGEIK